MVPSTRYPDQHSGAECVTPVAKDDPAAAGYDQVDFKFSMKLVDPVWDIQCRRLLPEQGHSDTAPEEIQADGLDGGEIDGRQTPGHGQRW